MIFDALNIMTDLETVGTGANAAIVAIGAVQFSENGLGKEFYATIDLEDCQRVGFDVEAATVLWWLKQSEAARHSTFTGNNTVYDALCQFSKYVVDLSIEAGSGYGDVAVWGNGPSFDNALLRNAYTKCRIDPPWKFWMDRCHRTLQALPPPIGTPAPMRLGTHHDALDDARTQAQHASTIFAALHKLWRES